jgi:integrase/recombinase XerC
MLFQHIKNYIDYMRVEKGASKLTLLGYKTDLMQFVNHIAQRYDVPKEELSLKMLNHKSVREYLGDMQERNLSRATMARKLAALRSYVKYLCRENILESNPIAEVSTPRQDKKLPKFLYSQEIELLMKAPDISLPLGRRDKAILETLYAAGLRVSELVSMDLKDIDFEERLIKIKGKGGKERIVPLGSKAAQALGIYIAKTRQKLVLKAGNAEDAVFLNKFGSRLSDRSVRNIINKYVEQVAINQKISPHTLRHTFATHLLNKGADLRSVQELLGHVKLSTTQIYTHLTRDSIKTIHNDTHPRR